MKNKYNPIFAVGVQLIMLTSAIIFGLISGEPKKQKEKEKEKINWKLKYEYLEYQTRFDSCYQEYTRPEIRCQFKAWLKRNENILEGN